jgi:hypothetical protein
MMEVRVRSLGIHNVLSPLLLYNCCELRGERQGGQLVKGTPQHSFEFDRNAAPFLQNFYCRHFRRVAHH